MSRRTLRHSRRERRGTAYLLAIGLGVLLATAVMGATLTARRVAARSTDALSIVRAERCAAAALAWGLRRLEVESEYSQGIVHSTRSQSASLDGAMLQSTVAPFVGTVAADRFAPASVSAVADAGVARRTLEARALPHPVPPSSLFGPLAVGGSLTIASSGTLELLEGEGRAGTVVVLSGAKTSGAIHAVAAGSADRWSATTATLRRPTFPSDAHLAALAAQATPITIHGGTLIERWLLSPTANPGGGGLDVRGLYLVECAGRTITIRSTRIVGTLILRDPGPGSRVEGSVHFEPALRGMPSLVVLGSMRIETSKDPLAEGAVPARNFNPFGTPFPFRGGEVDEDSSDALPSRFDGLVFVRDDLHLAGDVLLAGGLAVRGALRIEGSTVVGRDRWMRDAVTSALHLTRWRLDLGSLAERIGP